MEFGSTRHVPTLANGFPTSEAWLFAQSVLGNSDPSVLNPSAKATATRARLEWLVRFSPEYERELCRLVEAEADADRQQRREEFVARILNLDEEWDPSKHPRGGYPQNRGWFSPAWGAAAAIAAAGLGALLPGPYGTADEILDRAKTALDALVANHTMTQKERDLRINILDAALHHKMGFSISAPPNDRYYEPDAGGNWVLKRGQVASGLDDRVYNRSDHNKTGCTRASQSLLLQGMAVQAKKLGKADEFDKAVAGKPFDDLFPDTASSDYQNYSPDPKLADIVPGDRVWMRNHKFKPIDGKGYEGSNLIYLGKSQSGDQLFLHMDGGSIQTYPQLQRTVRGYSQPEARQDPDVNNYKFKSRYRPLVPPPSQ